MNLTAHRGKYQARKDESVSGVSKIVSRQESRSLFAGYVGRLVPQVPPVDCQPLRDVRERNEDVITIILQVAVVHRGDDLIAHIDGDTRHRVLRNAIYRRLYVVEPFVLKHRHYSNPLINSSGCLI